MIQVGSVVRREGRKCWGTGTVKEVRDLERGGTVALVNWNEVGWASVVGLEDLVELPIEAAN